MINTMMANMKMDDDDLYFLACSISRAITFYGFILDIVIFCAFVAPKSFMNIEYNKYNDDMQYSFI